MKPITITTTNIDKVIASVKKEIKRGNPFAGSLAKPAYFMLPKSEKVVSKRYKGKGRPRITDYDYKKIKWGKVFKANKNGFEFIK